MKSLLPRVGRWQVGVTLAALVLLVGVGYLTRPSWRSQVYPNPNGYDYFIAAGGRVVGDLARPVGADRETLRAFVDPNRQVLAELHNAAAYQSRVPLGEDQQRTLARNMEVISLVRKLGRLGMAAGALAEAEGRNADAIWAYLDVARLGRNAAFGGLVIDEMVGQVIRGQALEALDRLRSKLDAGQCRQLIAFLTNFESTIDAPADVIARERAWFFETSPWYIQAQLRWSPGVGASLKTLTQPAYRAFETASERDLLRIRGLLVLTAARLRRLDTGVDVDRIEELVPRYLRSVPRDPASGHLLRFPTEPGDGPEVDDALAPADTPDPEPAR